MLHDHAARAAQLLSPPLSSMSFLSGGSGEFQAGLAGSVYFFT
jgi:hypothetical protein